MLFKILLEEVAIPSQSYFLLVLKSHFFLNKKMKQWGVNNYSSITQQIKSDSNSFASVPASKL